MTDNAAITILKEQISSLRWVDDKTYDPWHTQTKSIIKDFFEFGSEEYGFISRFKFTSGYSDLPILNQLGHSKPTVVDFLERCIKTIERKQLFKPAEPVIKYVEKPVIKEVIKEVKVEVVKEVLVYPKKVNAFLTFLNWMKRRDILALIGTVIVVLGLPFGLGWYLGENKSDIKNIELRGENAALKADTATLGKQNRILLDSLRIKSSFNIPGNKPDSNTKSNQ